MMSDPKAATFAVCVKDIIGHMIGMNATEQTIKFILNHESGKPYEVILTVRSPDWQDDDNEEIEDDDR